MLFQKFNTILIWPSRENAHEHMPADVNEKIRFYEGHNWQYWNLPATGKCLRVIVLMLNKTFKAKPSCNKIKHECKDWIHNDYIHTYNIALAILLTYILTLDISRTCNFSPSNWNWCGKVQSRENNKVMDCLYIWNNGSDSLLATHSTSLLRLSLGSCFCFYLQMKLTSCCFLYLAKTWKNDLKNPLKFTSFSICPVFTF